MACLLQAAESDKANTGGYNGAAQSTISSPELPTSFSGMPALFLYSTGSVSGLVACML